MAHTNLNSVQWYIFKSICFCKITSTGAASFLREGALNSLHHDLQLTSVCPSQVDPLGLRLHELRTLLAIAFHLDHWHTGIGLNFRTAIQKCKVQHDGVPEERRDTHLVHIQCHLAALSYDGRCILPCHILLKIREHLWSRDTAECFSGLVPHHV